MNRKALQAVLRSVVGPPEPVTDAELLRRYAADRDDEAFAELVRRHGRLVWAVCRQLTRSDADADDAFQATFLVLVRRAGAVRDAGRLSAWLHGVAYKVCANARRAAATRSAREKVAAAAEVRGPEVPDSAWDRALAAVHEEVSRLPESLRIPFVLCCLEGKGATDAAAQVGWKLGTFSGRLTRAKDVVVERLNARGVALAAVVGFAAVGDVPAVAAERVIALAGGAAIPSSILQLSKGVIGMSLIRAKWLAAGVVVVCGLCAGGRAGWLATADAQSKPIATADDKAKAAEEKLRQLQIELDKARKEAETARDRAKAEMDAARKHLQDAAKAAKPSKPAVESVKEAVEKELAARNLPAKVAQSEYDYVLASEMGTTKFTAFLREREAKGWEFKGEATLQHEGKSAPHWVFKRAGGAKTTATVTEPSARATVKALTELATKPAAVAGLADKAKLLDAEKAKALEAELKALHEKLAALDKKPLSVAGAKLLTTTTATVKLSNATAREVAEQMKALMSVTKARAKADDLTISIENRTNSIVLTGSADAVKWAEGVIKSLDNK